VPSQDAIARAASVELRAHSNADPARQGKITSIVGAEIIRRTGE
jgi:hypothetical protein